MPRTWWALIHAPLAIFRDPVAFDRWLDAAAFAPAGAIQPVISRIIIRPSDREFALDDEDIVMRLIGVDETP